MRRYNRQLFMLVMAGGLFSGIFMNPLSSEAAKIISIEQYQQQAAKLDHYEDKLKLYEKALKQYPTFTGFYIERGNILMRQGDVKMADADFDKALYLDSKSFEAVSSKAVLYACDGKMREAWQLFEQAKQLEPENPMLYVKRGIYFYEGTADYPRAFADLDTAISLADEALKPQIYMEKITMEYDYASCYDQNFLPQVLTDSAAILEMANIPSVVQSNMHLIRGLVYDDNGSYPDSLRELEQALLLSGNHKQLQTAIFVQQAKLFHKLDMAREERAAWSAALQRNAKLPLPRHFAKDREAMLK